MMGILNEMKMWKLGILMRIHRRTILWRGTMIPALMQRKSNWKHSGPEVSEEERNELSEMFSFFDGLTRDAVAFIQKLFVSFDRETLNLFEQCFDIDLMVACYLAPSDQKKYGKEAFGKLVKHFKLLFSDQEHRDMKIECKKLKIHIQKIKRMQTWMKAVNIFADAIANRRALGLENIAVMLELLFKCYLTLCCPRGTILLRHESNKNQAQKFYGPRYA